MLYNFVLFAILLLFPVGLYLNIRICIASFFYLICQGLLYITGVLNCNIVDSCSVLNILFLFFLLNLFIGRYLKYTDYTIIVFVVGLSLFIINSWQITFILIFSILSREFLVPVAISLLILIGVFTTHIIYI